MEPTFIITNVTVQEGNNANFAIFLSNPCSTDTVIQVNTNTGTAISGLDFAPGQATVVIPAGAMSVNFSVPTLNDTISESSETFQLCGVVVSSNTVNVISCGECTISDGANAAISLSATGTYNDFNNDGFTNVGDVINYQYTVTNTGQEPLTNVIINLGVTPIGAEGVPLAGGPIETLSVGTSDSSTYSYLYVITQADINLGFVLNSSTVKAFYISGLVADYFQLETPLSISNGIKFNLFFDTNGNGLQNAGEDNYNGGNFTYQLNNGVIHTINSQNGMFTLYESNPANTYNLGCTLNTNNNFCNGQYTLATSSYSNISVANGSGITTYNFPVISNACNDLGVSLYQYGAPPRPGFTYMNQIKYTNNGNQTIASASVTFTRNTTVGAVSTSPLTTANASGFTYNFTNLLPNESRYIDVTMQVPVIPTVSLGQLLTNSVSVSLPPNDNNPVNNSDSVTQVIVGSYDPNDKTESHGGRILLSSFTANDYLTYKIQFENTGTFEAVNIRVNDILDAKLNPNTIRMVSASHPYVLDRVGNTLNWKFDGVNLPPSVANTQIGHGYIIFQIKPTAGYAVGDIIPNLANIYFDFNPPIVTDVCTTQFVSTLANTAFDASSLSIFPNPVQTNVTITNASIIDSVQLLSVLGQEVFSKKVNSLQTEINTENLTKGVYFIKIIAAGKEKTIKIVKE